MRIGGVVIDSGHTVKIRCRSHLLLVHLFLRERFYFGALYLLCSVFSTDRRATPSKVFSADPLFSLFTLLFNKWGSENRLL